MDGGYRSVNISRLRIINELYVTIASNYLHPVRLIRYTGSVRALDDARVRVAGAMFETLDSLRDEPKENWLAHAPFWGHVGVYGYRRKVLEEYDQLPEGLLEGAEKLEQLRLLETGLSIQTVEVGYRSRGVDTPEDLEQVKKMMETNL